MIFWNKVIGVGVPGRGCSIDYILCHLSNTSSDNIYSFAKAICDNISDNCNTIIAETERIRYRDDKLNDKLLNSEYYQMQQYIQNGSVVCSKLGLNFSVKEKDKHYERSIGFPYFRTGNFDIKYIITISGINKVLLMQSAESIRFADAQQRLKTIRAEVNDFYQRIANSDVVNTVAVMFANKLMDEIRKGYKHTFNLKVKNEYVVIPAEWSSEDQEHFIFAKNNLEDLKTNIHRNGFALAVADKICSIFSLEPEIIFREERDKEIALIKKFISIEPSTNQSNDASELTLTFEKETIVKEMKNWY